MSGSHPNPNYYASGAQTAYLKRLLLEAFGNLYPHRTGLDANRLENVTREEAAQAIDTLKAAKARGWQPDPTVRPTRAAPDLTKALEVRAARAAFESHFPSREAAKAFQVAALEADDLPPEAQAVLDDERYTCAYYAWLCTLLPSK